MTLHEREGTHVQEHARESHRFSHLAPRVPRTAAAAAVVVAPAAGAAEETAEHGAAVVSPCRPCTYSSLDVADGSVTTVGSKKPTGRHNKCGGFLCWPCL